MKELKQVVSCNKTFKASTSDFLKLFDYDLDSNKSSGDRVIPRGTETVEKKKKGDNFRESEARVHIKGRKAGKERKKERKVGGKGGAGIVSVNTNANRSISADAKSTKKKKKRKATSITVLTMSPLTDWEFPVLNTTTRSKQPP